MTRVCNPTSREVETDSPWDRPQSSTHPCPCTFWDREGWHQGYMVLMLRNCQSGMKRNPQIQLVWLMPQITRCSQFFLKMEMWISGWQSLVRVESLPAFALHLVWNSLLVAAWAISKECWKFIGRASATRVASAPYEFLPSPMQKTHGVLPFWVYVCVLCGLLGYFGTSFITLTSSF